MNLFSKSVLFLCWLSLDLHGSAGSEPKGSRPNYKSIKAQAETVFSRSVFSPCRGSRALNPVEKVKANIVATKIFRAHGPRAVIRFATRYGLPASAIYDLVDMGCRYILVVYSHFSEKGDCVLPKAVPTANLTTLSMTIARAIHQRDRFIPLRLGKKTFSLSQAAHLDYIKSLSDIVFALVDGKRVSDCNDILHTAAYTRGMLL